MIRKTLRAVALSSCLIAAPFAHGSATITNFSDLWWTPSESGWGANVTQQADLMFVTFFVYGFNGQPTWYSALLIAQGQQPDGSTLFTGNLYQSTGPYFGGSFSVQPVVTTHVGSASFRGFSTNDATLTWVIGNVSVVKDVERLTLRADNYGGQYIGGTSDITSNCTLPSRNNLLTEESGVFTVTHVGSVMEIRSPTCTYTGTHTQQGQISRLDGNYTCTNGATGESTFFDLRVEPGGLSGRYFGSDTSCSFTGNIGLARRK